MTTAVDVFNKLAQVSVETNDSGAMLDLCADDVVFEFPFAPPGRPARVEGKPALGDCLKALSGRVRLEGMRNLEIHETVKPDVAIIEMTLTGTGTATGIRATSAIATSAGAGCAGFVDAGDIAQVAVEALLTPAAMNTDLILTGPESLSYDDVAAILTETSGRAITHKRLDPADQPAYYEALGMPEFTARFLVGMDWVIASGAEDRTTDTVKRVTGTPPRSFRDFAVAEFHA
jgi:ketosteroid isomerase-like protein